MTKQRQLIVVAVFAFGFGLAFVGEAQAGSDPCCIIPATPHCNEGIGTWVVKFGTGECVYQLVPGNPDICQFQIPPECF